MKRICVLLLPLMLVGIAYAGSWIEDAPIVTTTGAGFLSWNDAILDSCISTDALWDHSPRDTANSYVVRVDTTLNLKRIECDTTLKQINTDSLGQPEFAIHRVCDTVYYRHIDTVWAEKLVVRLTPEEYKAFKALLNERIQ